MGYAITTDGLGRMFGSRWAVRDLNLKIETGEVFGLLGPNGAGKTTIMRMLSSLIAPTAGNASVCDFDVVAQADQVRRHIGILSEPAGLYDNLPARRNLEYFAKLYDLDPTFARKQIQKYLQLFGLWDRKDDLAGTFSRGMKQKLSLARSLLHEPAVVILDEPTSALDPEGAKLVRDSIIALQGEGRTIILCTHNLAEAQLICTRVGIVKRTLIRVGTPRELQEALYGRQIEIKIGNPLPHMGDVSTLDERLGRTMNDFALLATRMRGVGDVAVSGSSLLVSMLDPDDFMPDLVRMLVLQGADVIRVAEVEHSLERAYLDLVARQDLLDAQAAAPMSSTVAPGGVRTGGAGQ
ncbi:MAG TPA: ABC transporter ATP-binding protein [Chloroflexia bacterium]|nr:ABC transporter ATP-binding protein [Chloroflexia bacterium]